METKYKYDVGDEVIILLGHPMWITGAGMQWGPTIFNDEKTGMDIVDAREDLVGKKATIKLREPSAGGKPMYALDIEGEGWMAWFKEPQIIWVDAMLKTIGS